MSLACRAGEAAAAIGAGLALALVGAAALSGPARAGGPIVLICEVSGGSAAQRAIFQPAFCDEVGDGVAYRFGRRVVVSELAARQWQSVSGGRMVAVEARILGPFSADGRVSWGAARTGLPLSGGSTTISVDASDAELGEASARLLGRELVRAMPEVF